MNHLSRKDKKPNTHNHSDPKQKEVIKLNDPKAVLEAIGRQERAIQGYDKQFAEMNMNFMILQEYSISLGGTQEGYVKLREKRMGDAQEQMQKMMIQQTQGDIDKHTDSGILGPDGKPMSSSKPIVMDTTPPDNMAPMPGEDVIIDTNSSAVTLPPIKDKDTPPTADDPETKKHGGHIKVLPVSSKSLKGPEKEE